MNITIDSDKSFLRNDTSNLFLSETNRWSFDTPPTTRFQADRHGTAFASVGIPPQYAALYCVLRELVWRVESEVEIERIMEWGGGTGAGMWATLHAFQRTNEDEPSIASSSVKSYVVFDKRDGLVALGKRLLECM